MRERDLARLRRIAPANERRRARRVMRRAKWPPPPLLGREADRTRREDRRRGERFVVVHRRKQARQARGEHRFARAGRPDHQEVMSARRRYFERAARGGMTDHVGEIGGWRIGRSERCGVNRSESRIGDIVQMRAERRQVRRAEDFDARHQRRLRRARERHVDFRDARVRSVHRCVMTRRAADHCERAAHRTQRAGQRQLAGELAMLQRLSRNLPARGEYAERDRQICYLGVSLTVSPNFLH